MERNKILTIAVIGLLLLNAAIIGFLWLDKPPHSMKAKGGPASLIIERLHFDTNQEIEFRKLAKVHHEEFKKLQQISIETHQEYYKLMKQEDIDSMKVDSLRQIMASNQQSIDKLNFEHFLDIKKLCNTEQKILFNDFADEIGGLFNERPPHGRGQKRE